MYFFLEAFFTVFVLPSHGPGWDYLLMLKPVIGKRKKVILISLDKFPFILGSEEKFLH